MRLNEFFGLNEASMHAWKNLGYDPETKAYLEKMYGPDYAYDVGIGFLAMLEPEERTRAGIEHAIMSSQGMGGEDPVLLLLKKLKKSEPFKKALRHNAPNFLRLSKQDPQKAADALHSLFDLFPDVAPDNYASEDAVFLTTRRGWKWVNVEDMDCRDFEGGQMQHCGVAADNMVSLRDPTGKPHVTGDLEYGKGVLQMRGKQNSVPDRKYWPDIEDLLEDMYTFQHGPVAFSDPVWLEEPGPDFLEKVAKRGLIQVTEMDQDDPAHWNDQNMQQDDDPAERERMHAQLRQNLGPDRIDPADVPWPAPGIAEVFIIREASMHAWKNLGLSPELKKYMESTFAGSAYEVAIALLPVAKEAIFHDQLPDVEAFQELLANEDPWSTRTARQVMRSPKLRDAIRREASKISKMGAEKGIEMINNLVGTHAADAPENYDKAEVFLDLGPEWPGWKWVQVADAACMDHEGNLMQHCGQGHQNMLSLRDPQGKPHVTADVNPTLPWVGQLKGKQNAVVPEKYWEMCGELFKELMRLTGKKPEFEDHIYLNNKQGEEFMLYLKEFGFAKIAPAVGGPRDDPFGPDF